MIVNWKYVGQNIYIKGYTGSISKFKFNERIQELGGNIVTLNTKEKIDIVIFSDAQDGNNEAKLLDKLIEKYARKGLAPVEFVNQELILKSMGFSPLQEFKIWEEYPNYNPFTGERLNIWDSNKVEQGIDTQISQEISLDLDI